MFPVKIWGEKSTACMYFIYAFSFIQERNKSAGTALKKKKIRLSVETKKNKKERLSVVAALDSVRFLQVSLHRCMT